MYFVAHMKKHFEWTTFLWLAKKNEIQQVLYRIFSKFLLVGYLLSYSLASGDVASRWSYPIQNFLFHERDK